MSAQLYTFKPRTKTPAPRTETEDAWIEAARENFKPPVKLERFLDRLDIAFDNLHEKNGSWFTREKPFMNKHGEIEIHTSAGKFTAYASVLVHRPGASVMWFDPKWRDPDIAGPEGMAGMELMELTLRWDRLEARYNGAFFSIPARFFRFMNNQLFKRHIMSKMESCVRRSSNNPDRRALMFHYIS